MDNLIVGSFIINNLFLNRNNVYTRDISNMYNQDGNRIINYINSKGENVSKTVSEIRKIYSEKDKLWHDNYIKEINEYNKNNPDNPKKVGGLLSLVAYGPACWNGGTIEMSGTFKETNEKYWYCGLRHDYANSIPLDD